MNDDPGSSSAVGQQRPGPGIRVPRARQQQREEDGDGQVDGDVEMAVARKEMRRAGLAKKMSFLSDLMRSLDTVFSAEVCVLYYMDCSLPRLLLRVFPHLIYLAPKSDLFPLHMPAQPPHVLAILVPNLICMLVHLVWAAPAAAEAARGYLHGGVIVDFIGQKAPASRGTLLAIDAVILAVQCVMLAVHQEREILRKAVTGGRRRGDQQRGNAGSGEQVAGGTQDHDAEERGILRDATTHADDTHAATDVDRGDDGDEEDAAADGSHNTFGPSGGATTAATDLMDVMRSGNAVLADLHVVDAMRVAGTGYQTAAAYSLQSLGYHATLVSIAAESRARMAGR